ncbi:MAG: T9SS type A sorting domain-containing protein [Bacteroidota bacterium]
MKNYQITLALAVVMTAFSLTIASANSDPEEPNPRAEIREQIHVYKNTNIVPVLLELKSRVDAALSDEDLAALNELRRRASQLRDEMRGIREEIRSRRQAGEDIDRRAYAERLKALRERMRALAKELKELAPGNEEIIRMIAEELKSHKDEWKSDIRNIIKEHRGDTDNPGRGRHKDKMHGKKSGKRAIAHFLLWDGDAAHLPGPAHPPAMKDRSQSIEVGAAPNPFTESVEFTFELTENQQVNLDIYNNRGELIANVFDGKLGAGAHTLRFVTNSANKNMMPGVFIYKLSAGAGSATGKIIYSR